MVETRCHNLQLAEGTGRRRCSRHDHLKPPSCGAIGVLYTALAVAQDFQADKKSKLIDGIFRGQTINTPSMLCVADYLDALAWIDSIGGLSAAIARSEANLAIIEEFVEKTSWLSFLARDPATVSNTSVCLSVDASPEQVKEILKLLEIEKVALDIGAYRDAPPGLRVWCGVTVEKQDVALLVEWLASAYVAVVSKG